VASALVTSIAGGGKPATNVVNFTATVYFSGDDVPDEIHGQAWSLSFSVPLGYTLGDFKTAMSTAVQDLAVALGLGVVAGDIDLPSFEAGGGPPP
jgi:hypothetical protein